MKPFMTKQGMLKASLFVALAANVSFQPLKHLNHANLSTVTPEARVATPSGSAAPATPAKGVSTPTVDTKAAPATPSAVAPLAGQTPVASNPEANPQQNNSYYMELCGGTRKHRVTFSEIKVNNEVKTKATAEILEGTCANCIAGEAVGSGGLTSDNRTRIQGDLAKALEAAYKCDKNPAPAVGATGTTVSATTQPAVDPQEDHDEQVRTCEEKRVISGSKTSYVALEGEAKIRCNMNRLRNLRVQLSASLGHAPSKEELADAAKEILNSDMMNDIRELARSKDSDDNRKGRELADDVHAALDSFRRTTGVHDSELTKDSKTLLGYEKAADIQTRENEYGSSLDSLETKMQRAQERYQRTGSMAAQFELNNLQMQGVQLRNRFNYETQYNDPFALIESQDLLSHSDLDSFRQPFDQLTDRYTAFSDYLSGKGSLESERRSMAQMPSGLFNQRSSYYDDRFAGISLSALPTTAPRLSPSAVAPMGSVGAVSVPPANRLAPRF